uniref:Uncharacterized protein n=1 Tax=Anguilla anguilla TaxID=7936 RepID=A0A0E9W0K1_ANGAN
MGKLRALCVHEGHTFLSLEEQELTACFPST